MDHFKICIYEIINFVYAVYSTLCTLPVNKESMGGGGKGEVNFYIVKRTE